MNRSLSVLLLLLFCTFSLNSASAQDKPLLSEAIREAIDSRGVEEAKNYFLGLDSSERARYNIDTEGISDLTTSYLDDGNMDALMAVSEISAVFMQDMVSRAMEEYAPELEEMERRADQQRAERELEAKAQEDERRQQEQQRIEDRQGQPRSDLDRFTGLYGHPESDNPHRQLWVQVSCDGYLVSGAMWGDASPWWLRSENDNVFTFSSSFSNIRMEFRTGSGGILQLVHNLEFMESPLQRTGPLPDDWDSCLERYR